MTMFNFKRLSIYHQSWLFGGFFCLILIVLIEHAKGYLLWDAGYEETLKDIPTGVVPIVLNK